MTGSQFTFSVYEAEKRGVAAVHRNHIHGGVESDCASHNGETLRQERGCPGPEGAGGNKRQSWWCISHLITTNLMDNLGPLDPKLSCLKQHLSQELGVV